MLKTIVLLTVALTVTSQTAEEDDQTSTNFETTTVPITHLTRTQNVIKFIIKHLKNKMSESLDAHNVSHVTDAETEELKVIVDAFFERLAIDLREPAEKPNTGDSEAKHESVEAKRESEEETVDERFEEVKNYVRAQFSNLNEETAGEVINKLRKNLQKTSAKLDEIVRNSKNNEAELDY